LADRSPDWISRGAFGQSAKIGIVKSLLLLILGLAALYQGAEWLVRGASRIAAALRVSPLVIGLTVVAFGTSTPEMLAGVVAAWNGRTDIVLGNVFGSNIANIGLILGLAAILRRIPINLALLRREAPIMLLATAAVYVLAARGSVGRLAGGVLFAGLVVFTSLAVRWARGARAAPKREFEQFSEDRSLTSSEGIAADAVRLGIGLVALALGAHLVVGSAVQLARQFGVSEFLISVSMVAIGTSLPELATSLMAVTRGEHDVLVGNIVGSNIFNLLGAFALSAMVRPLPVSTQILTVDLPVVVAFSLAMYLALWSRRAIVRWEGAVLLAGYLAYIALRFL